MRRQRLAYAANWSPYAMERTIGRPSADIYLVDIDTGARTKVKDAIDDQYLQASPGGRYLLYLQADQYWTIDTATRATVNISKAAADVLHQPRVGRDGEAEAVVRRRRLDQERRGRDSLRQVRRVARGGERIGRVAPDRWRDRAAPPSLRDGSIPTKSGSTPASRSISASSASGRKRSGYARLDPGAVALKPLVLDDKSITGLAKAKDAERLSPTPSRRSTIRRT